MPFRVQVIFCLLSKFAPFEATIEIDKEQIVGFRTGRNKSPQNQCFTVRSYKVH